MTGKRMSNEEFAADLDRRLGPVDDERAQLRRRAEAAERVKGMLVEALDPETLSAVAVAISYHFPGNAQALRTLAAKARAAIDEARIP